MAAGVFFKILSSLIGKGIGDTEKRKVTQGEATKELEAAMGQLKADAEAAGWTGPLSRFDEERFKLINDAMGGVGRQDYAAYNKYLTEMGDSTTRGLFGSGKEGDYGNYSFINELTSGYGDAKKEMLDLLNNVPQYKIPDAIKELKDNLSSYATDIEKQYGMSADELMKMVDEVGTELKAKEAQTEKDFLGSQNEMLNIYRDIYKGDFGQKILQDKLGAQTAGQVSKIKELGAGSGAALSSISQLYSGQQEGMRDLAVQVKQYRNQSAMNLAQAQERSNQALATIRQNAVANRLSQEQIQAGAISQAANLRGTGIQAAADLRTTGATTLAGYEDKAYQMNEYAPWAAKAGFYGDMMGQMNPYPYLESYASDRTSAQLGFALGNQQTANNQAQNQSQFYQSLLSFVGDLFKNNG